jgi:fatty-acyl-CoA synthase
MKDEHEHAGTEAEVLGGVINVAVFGQTEMSPVTCALDGAGALRKIGSVGKPVATMSARIVNDDMTDVRPGEVGEIVNRGPTAMSGYWQNPAATAEAFRGGWFHSGDLVRADSEGFLYVVDHKKDMITTGGENVYCAEVENALAAHPAITELAVIGAPDERWARRRPRSSCCSPASRRLWRSCVTGAVTGSPGTSSRPSCTWWMRCRAKPAARS